MEKNKKISNNGYEYVDLGLPSGTLWATCNVGASSPSDFGLYFQWGDIKGYPKEQVGKDKQFNCDDYKFSIDGSDLNFSKYTKEGAELDFEDDAAHIHMEGDWHMPTPNQFKELINGTTSEWTTQDGVNGRLFTSKKDGTKSIFIPAAGIAWDDTVLDRDRYGKVWLSMLSAYHIGYGQYLYICPGYASLDDYHRSFRFSVRGVIG